VGRDNLAQAIAGGPIHGVLGGPAAATAALSHPTIAGKSLLGRSSSALVGVHAQLPQLRLLAHFLETGTKNWAFCKPNLLPALALAQGPGIVDRRGRNGRSLEEH
jgi:hypothetical protein